MARSVLVALSALCVVLGTVTAQPAVNNGLDHCAVYLGTLPAGDGTFEQEPTFRAELLNGYWSLPASGVPPVPGENVFYVIPVDKERPPPTVVTPETRNSADFCHSASTLQTQFNPLAVAFDSNETLSNLQVGQLSTVLVFGQAYGLTEELTHVAFGLDDPTIEISTYPAAQLFAADPSGPGGDFYKEDNKVSALVTLGSSLLSNQSSYFSSFAVLINQAVGRAAASAANARLNAQESSTIPALNLNDPVTVTGILRDAAGQVQATRDPAFPSKLNQLPDAAYAAVASSVASIADQINNATSVQEIAGIIGNTENNVAPLAAQLGQGSIGPNDYLLAAVPGSTPETVNLVLQSRAEASGPEGPFNYGPPSPSWDASPAAAPSTDSISTPIAAVPAAVPLEAGSAQDRESSAGNGTQPATTAQAAQGSKHHGLSGGAIAGIVIGCVVGAALIAALAIMGLRALSGAEGQSPVSSNSPTAVVSAAFARLMKRDPTDNPPMRANSFPGSSSYAKPTSYAGSHASHARDSSV